MAFIIVDETENNLVLVTDDITDAADEAKNHHDKTGNKVEIYVAFKEAA